MADETSTPTESDKPKAILVNELLVGEHKALIMAGEALGLLRNMEPKYLRSLIAKMEIVDHENISVPLPVFKILLFYVEDLRERIENDKDLQALLKRREEDEARKEFMEGAHIVPV